MHLAFAASTRSHPSSHPSSHPLSHRSPHPSPHPSSRPSCAPVVVLALLSGCVFDADLAPGARVTCRGPADCPPGVECIDGFCSARDAPSAVSGTLAAVEDEPLDVALDGSSPIGAALTFRVVDAPRGTLVIGDDGTGTYTPPPDFAGADAFTFVVSSPGEGGARTLESAPATVVVDVAPVNDAPVLAFEPLLLVEDTAQGVDLAITDADGDDITLAVTTQPEHGSATLIGGVLLYDPAPDYAGSDSVVVEAFDGAARAAGTIAIEVAPINDLAVVVAESINATEDEDTEVELEAEDADGETVFTWRIVDAPAQGDASIDAGSGVLVYRPRANFTGDDALTVAVTDSSGEEGPATALLITVANADDRPDAVPQTHDTFEDEELSLVLAGTSPDPAPLQFVVGTPQHGTVQLDDNFAANHLVRYRPPRNYNGTDVFTFQVISGSAASDPAEVNINVLAVADAPAAFDAELDVDEDSFVDGQLAGEAPDAPSVLFEIVSDPPVAHGTLTVAEDFATSGSFTYTPDADYFGDDELVFVVRAGDGTEGVSAPATVTFDVDPVFDAPLSFDATATTDEDEIVVIDLAGFSPDGDAVVFELIGASPTLGFVEGAVGFAESGVVVYEPFENVSGQDVFHYKVKTVNGAAISAIATVTVTIRAVNDRPTLSFVGPVELLWRLGVDEVAEVSAFDVDGDDLTIEVEAQGTLGQGAPDTTVPGVLGVRYTPDDGTLLAPGRDVLRVAVVDENGGRTSVPLEVTVVSARGCAAARNTGATEDGIYTFATGPGFTNPYRAFCDMNDDGGGWTLLASFRGDDTRFIANGPAWLDAVGFPPEEPTTPLSANFQAMAKAALTEIRVETFDRDQNGALIGTLFADVSAGPVVFQQRSLRDLHAAAVAIPTSLGEGAWESLVLVGALGTLCDEGANTPTVTAPCVLCAVGASSGDCPASAATQVELGVGLSTVGAGVVDRVNGTDPSPRVLVWGRDLDFTDDLSVVFDVCSIVDDRFSMSGFYNLTSGPAFCNL